MERKMKDSGIPWIGQIPEHWEVMRLRRVFSEAHEKTTDESGQLLTLSQYTGISPKSGDKRVGMFEAESTVGYNIVHAGQFVMNIMLAWNGSYGVSDFDGIISPAYVVFNFNFKCCKKYFHYLLRLGGYPPAFKTVSRGIIESRLRLYPIYFYQFLTIVPPLSEQEAIAAYLDKKCGEIDELIEVEQQMISDLESYRQSVITEAVTHGLNPDTRMVESDCDWFASHPSHWRTEKIRNLFVKRTEKNNPIKTKERLSLSIDKGITLYADKTTNLDRFKDDFTQYQLAHPNDIVLNSMNMIVGAVGKSAYFGCVSPVYYVIYSKDANVNMDFYGYLLNTPVIRDVYHKLGQGIYAIERGDGRVNTCRLKVDYYEFNQIKVPVPPEEEQNTIVSFLKEKEYEIDELIKVKQEKIETLKQYRQSLIFEAVTGKTLITINA